MSDNFEVRADLIPAAHAALEDTAILLGFSRNAVINRALQLYAYLEMERHVHGADVLLRDPDGTVNRLSFNEDPDTVARRQVQPPAPRAPWWWRWAS